MTIGDALVIGVSIYAGLILITWTVMVILSRKG